MPCRPALSEQSDLTGIRHTSKSSQATELVNMSLGKLVAAGSTVTKDVDDNALAISRTPQKNLENKGKEIMDINKAKKESKK